MPPPHLFINIVLVVIVLAAAATDLRSRKIPNWLTLPAVCLGLGLNWIFFGVAGLKTSASGMLLGFAVYFALYCLRAMGAGDAKLMAAVGAFVGPQNWLLVFIATALAGGVLAVGLVVWKGRLLETLGRMFLLVKELLHFRAPFERHKGLDVKDPHALKMPHGVAIATGVVACLLLKII